MIVNDLFPTVKQLNKSDKIRLLQYLVTEIAKDEETNTKEEEDKFWLATSLTSLQEIWEHSDEEVYNELL
jgi:hypothetical protein